MNFKKIKSVIFSGMLAATSVASTFSMAAPSLNAAAANDDYAKLLQYSLYFYDANMCGNISSKCGLAWRGNCHTTDEVPGGFHDAGDHAMFGLPQGYTASTLGWAYYEFKDAFEATGQGEHLKVITDHFCEFFRNATKLNGDSVSRFIYQKGDGTVDHSYWGPPEQQGSREMFWQSNGAGEVAAEYAASLAANYVNFGNTDDLKYAKALYNYSLQNGSAAPNNFYGSNSVGDDQAWAAGWLYLATKDDRYLNDLKSKLPEVGWVHGWNDTHLGAACLLGEITGDWNAANGYMGSKANGGGYMFLDKWGSARLNCSMQMTALIAAKHNKGNYQEWAKGQMDYILGNNPANTCFVTGFASNSAKNAHHRAASGYTSYEQFNMNGWDPDGNHMSPSCQYGGNSHTLIGALVGGPCDAGGTYHDNMADYICNEVAIDYNAGLVGAAAGLYHFYKTGNTVSNIEGVTKIYSGSGNNGNNGNNNNNQQPTEPPTNPPTQPDNNNNNNNNQQPTDPPSTPGVTGSNGKYTAALNQAVDYEKLPADDKMFGWQWSELGVPAGEQPTKVVFHISANGNIGTYVGAFGSSTTVSPEYWTQSKDINESINSNSGTLTWELDDATSKIIQTQYKGELKLGVWWVDCKQFTIDSIDIYTTGGSGNNGNNNNNNNQQPTQAPTNPPTNPPTQPDNNNNNNNNNNGVTAKLYGDANCDGAVTIADCTLILQCLGNPDRYKLSEQGAANADCCNNGDGVSGLDALAIQKVDAGVYKASQLPVRG